MPDQAVAAAPAVQRERRLDLDRARGIAILLVVFGTPLAFPSTADWSIPWFGVVALTLTYSAYVAEVYRAGLASIHPSQSAAARSADSRICRSRRDSNAVKYTGPRTVPLRTGLILPPKLRASRSTRL